jgi:hypothetical protein
MSKLTVDHVLNAHKALSTGDQALCAEFWAEDMVWQVPGVINIFFDENHNVVSVEPKSDLSGGSIDLRVVVAWQASWFNPPAAKSTRTSMDAIQDWSVKASDKNPYGLVITRCNAMAEPFKYAPGFARL